jgi:hypothetical protein
MKNFVAGYGRQGRPEFLEVLQATVPLAGLFGLKPSDNLRKMQGLAKLAGHKHLLAHDLAAMGPGSQHPMQCGCRLESGCDIKLFVVQT